MDRWARIVVAAAVLPTVRQMLAALGNESIERAPRLFVCAEQREGIEERALVRFSSSNWGRGIYLQYWMTDDIDVGFVVSGGVESAVFDFDLGSLDESDVGRAIPRLLSFVAQSPTLELVVDYAGHSSLMEWGASPRAAEVDLLGDPSIRFPDARLGALPVLGKSDRGREWLDAYARFAGPSG